MSGSNNLFIPSDLRSSQFLDQFLSCRYVNNFLARQVTGLVQPIFVEVNDFPYAKTDFAYSDQTLSNLAQALIVIPKRLFSGEALSKMAFEVMNCMRGKFTCLDDQAKAGNLNVDDYTLQKEMLEIENGHMHDKIVTKCASSWKIPKREIRNHLMSVSGSSKEGLEVEAWTQDFMAHGDVHRCNWLDHFQKAYCKQHLKDKRSCRMKKKDLVDFSAFNQMPIAQQGKIMAQRVCSRFLKAPRHVQKSVLDIAEANCPSVVRKSKIARSKDEL